MSTLKTYTVIRDTEKDYGIWGVMTDGEGLEL